MINLKACFIADIAKLKDNNSSDKFSMEVNVSAFRLRNVLI